MGLIVIAGVVVVTEATRNVPVTYAKSIRGTNTYGGTSTYLPLRVNQAGVIPIIFAISILLFPGLAANFFLTARTPAVAHFAAQVIAFFQTRRTTRSFTSCCVVVFTYFYTAVVFNPEDVAENIQNNGGFIPGLRPGKQTSEYLSTVLNLDFMVFGAVFLGLIAVLPFALLRSTSPRRAVRPFGGTSLLIVVAVVIETIKAVEAQLVMHSYE